MNHDELVTFASVLKDAGTLHTPDDVIYFFEKPHKYEREYALWKVFEFPMEGDSNWPQFVEAVIEGAYAEDFNG